MRMSVSGLSSLVSSAALTLLYFALVAINYYSLNYHISNPRLNQEREGRGILERRRHRKYECVRKPASWGKVVEQVFIS